MTRLSGFLAAATVLIAAPVASADPAVPQPDTPCSPALAGVTTLLPGTSAPLVCQDRQWQPVPLPADASDRWLTAGPAIALHGEGLRNPNLESGDWTATQLDPTARCRAEQRAVVSAGVVGAPQVSDGAAGQPLSLTVLPSLYSIELSGHCLWTRNG